MANKMRAFLFICAMAAVGYSMYHDGIGFGNISIGILVLVSLFLNLRFQFRQAKARAEEEQRKLEKQAAHEAKKNRRRPGRHGVPKQKGKTEQKSPAADEKE